MSDRAKIIVTHDDDGGITVKCPTSGVVISIIETHPAVIGEKAAIVECYSYDEICHLEHAITQRGLARCFQFNLWTSDGREVRDA